MSVSFGGADLEIKFIIGGIRPYLVTEAARM